MKKFVKNLLFGAGIAAAGLIVYSMWKDAEEPVVVENASVEPPATTLSKEYVERRRRQIREAAELVKSRRKAVHRLLNRIPRPLNPLPWSKPRNSKRNSDNDCEGGTMCRATKSIC